MNWTPTTTTKTTPEIVLAWEELRDAAVAARDRAIALFNGGDVVSTLKRFGADPTLIAETEKTMATLRRLS
jgi:hypothetical protein